MTETTQPMIEPPMIERQTIDQPMIELRHVTKRFGGFTAVDDVSLAIAAGEFLTLLGPSGCGKTTLLRMLSGFETPTDGQVFLNGQDVTALPPHQRDVNQVFQGYALFPHLTVRDNVEFGLRMKKVPRHEITERVEQAIAMVSLAGFETRKPHQLSGGQRQRVALARAIVNRPKVLLLDEPLSALDAKLRQVMQLELKRLQSRLGITFVFVTHDQEEALTMSDRIAVINRGKIEQLGSATEIYHTPRTRFVADFIGQSSIHEGTIVLRESGGVRVRLAGDLVLTVEDADPPTGERVLVSIRPEKIRLSREPAAGNNAFVAKVTEAVFRGPTAELQLLTRGGLELTAVLTNTTTAARPFTAGEDVTCEIHAADICLLEV